jgi:hypothetical protein
MTKRSRWLSAAMGMFVLNAEAEVIREMNTFIAMLPAVE